MDFKKLENFIYSKVTETRLPGVSVALSRDGETIWERGFGVNHIDKMEPATPETIYGIASVTKSFTALAIMQLAEAGKLSVEDPISTYLPVDIRPFSEPIRIHHLMSHTSGIGALASSERVLRIANGVVDGWLPLATADDLYTYLDGAEEWVVARPGERHLYLNEGYLLLGEIIANLSGMRYEDYVHQHILTPLGMNRTFYKIAELEADYDVTTPHLITPTQQIPKAFPFNMLSAAGRLASNTRDLLRYVQMYLNGGELDGTRVISSQSIEQMMAPRVNKSLDGGYFGQEEYGYGLGTTPDVFGKRLVGHSGSIGVCTSYMGMIPEEKLGVVVLANGTGYSPMMMAIAALGTALGQDPADLPFERDERILKQLTGRYETFRGNTSVTVKRDGTYLMVQSKDKIYDITTPLAVQSISAEKCVFTVPAPEQTLTVEFIIKDDTVDMVFERYLFRKVSS